MVKAAKEAAGIFAVAKSKYQVVRNYKKRGLC